MQPRRGCAPCGPLRHSWYGAEPYAHGDVQSRGGILMQVGKAGPSGGFDRGPYGMGMQGWAPIKQGNRVVGTVRPISLTEQLLQEIHVARGWKWQCLSPAKGLHRATPLLGSKSGLSCSS